MTSPTMVVVDDDEPGLSLLDTLCRQAGFETKLFSDARKAKADISRLHELGALAGVVTDLKLFDTFAGWSVIQYAYTHSPRLSLAIYTAYFEHEIVELFTSGAAIPSFTVFRKPYDKRELQTWLKSQFERWDSKLSFVLKDTVTHELYNTLAPIYARSNLPILILGETGTGKENLAKHVHNESGATGPFVAVNCGGLEPSVAFAELFGHQQGAFTDAVRNELGLVLTASGYSRPAERPNAREGFVEWLRRGNNDLVEEKTKGLRLWSSQGARKGAGTLFLDEVGSLPPKIMGGLLRVLSSQDAMPLGFHGHGIRTYARIIAATNETHALESISGGELPTSATPGTSFRSDFYYRMSGAVLYLLPLRDRDPREIEHYIESPFSWQEIGMSPLECEDAAITYVQDLFHRRTDPVARQYQNGNFRSLRNLLHRASLVARRDNAIIIAKEHFKIATEHGALTVQGVVAQEEAKAVPDLIRQEFRTHVLQHEIDLPPNFGSSDLRMITKTQPEKIAAAVLSTMLNRPSSMTKDLQLGQVETALYGLHGEMSSNAFFSKALKKEHFVAAAIQFFGADAAGLKPDCTIAEVVKKLRESRAQFAKGSG